MTLGDALGFGLGQGVNNFVSTNNQFEQQRQQQANFEATRAFQKQQADLAQKNVLWSQQRTAQLDSIGQREGDYKSGLAPQMNSFMQGVQLDLERYAPTLKDGSPNPQYDPALYQGALDRKKQVGKLWSDVGLGVGHGENWEEAKGKFLSFIGGDAPAQQSAPPTQPGQPMPEVPRQNFPDYQPMQPVTATEPGGAEFTYTPAGPPAAAPQSTAPTLPNDVRALSGKDLLGMDNATLTQRYGQAGAEYAISKRAAYVQQVQKQQADAAKVRADGWDTQLKELSKRTDLTGDQRLAMATITSLMAKPELSDHEAGQLTDAFQLLTPRLYDATSWQKVLETKDPATILAQLPVYQKYAPNVVGGFDPAPYQRILDDGHDLNAAKVATEGSVQGKNEADANKTNVEAGRMTELLPGEVAGQQAKNDNLTADTALKNAQGQNFQAQTTKTLADAAGNRQKEVTGLLANFGTFPTDMTYKQIAAQAAPAIAKIKEVLGIDDAGVANLIGQAQYKYGLGIKGEELKTQLAQAKVNTQAAQTGLVQTQTAATAQRVVNDTALAQSTVQANAGRANASNAAAAASLAQAQQIAALTAPKVQQVQANINSTNTKTAVAAGQGAANIALTNARAGQVQAATLVNYADAARTKAAIQNDANRTAAYVAGVKGKYAVDMAQVSNLNAKTLLVQAQDPNSPFYNPKVAAAKGKDPLAIAKDQSSLKYKQADQALQTANTMQTQINSLKKEGMTMSGAFDPTRLSPASQKQLNSLVAQRDKLMAQSLNAQKAGDTIIQIAMLGDAKKNPPAPVMPKVNPAAPIKQPAPASSANAPTVTVKPASATKPAASPAAGLGIPRPNLSGNNVKAGPVFEQKLADAVKQKNAAGIEYFAGQLVKLGYKDSDLISWIQRYSGGNK